MIQKVTYVRCDDCGECPNFDLGDEGQTATEQRRHFKTTYGWTVLRSEGVTYDFCGACMVNNKHGNDDDAAE